MSRIKSKTKEPFAAGPVVYPNAERNRVFGSNDQFPQELNTVYYSGGDHRARGVYNLTAAQAKIVVQRIMQDPNMPEREILADMTTAVCADEKEISD